MISDERNKHTLEVAREMLRVTKEEHPGDKDYQGAVFLIGLLHDIGYEFTNNPKNHAKVGGRLLKEQGYRYWKEVSSHGDAESEYTSKELDLLNSVDMGVDGKGTKVSYEERLEGIEERHGKESWQYKNSERIVKKLKDRGKKKWEENEYKTQQ